MKGKTDKELAKVLWDYNRSETPLKKADIILGLGNNDIKIAQHAAKLLLEGWAPLILFTGSFGLLTKESFTKPEAEVFADEAMKLGIPREKILIENKATNTGENILFSKKLLEENKLNPKKFIVITKPHQLRRAYATFVKVWPGQKLVMNSINQTLEEYFKDLSGININALVAVTQRVMVYPEKGFQIPQEIPKEVQQAYEELVRRGYNKQLVS